MKRKPIIAVIGGNTCTASIAEIAEETGRIIAEQDWILVCGGRGGVMEAACKGAMAAGGVTVGILPDEDDLKANPFVSIPIATGMGIARNAIIARSADAVIAIDGSYGTLSEIAFALQLEKPVYCINSWNEIPGVIGVETPHEAIEQISESFTKQQ
jgi:hypothetical protein